MKNSRLKLLLTAILALFAGYLSPEILAVLQTFVGSL